MGDTRSEETILVKDMWWDGNDFHIIDMDDNHQVFKDASIVGYSNQEIDDSTVIETEIVSNDN